MIFSKDKLTLVKPQSFHFEKLRERAQQAIARAQAAFHRPAKELEDRTPPPESVEADEE